MEGWVQVFSTTDAFSAESCRIVLESEGISTVLSSKQDQSFGYGDFVLSVEEPNAQPAWKILVRINEGFRREQAGRLLFSEGVGFEEVVGQVADCGIEVPEVENLLNNLISSRAKRRRAERKVSIGFLIGILGLVAITGRQFYPWPWLTWLGLGLVGLGARNVSSGFSELH